MGPTHSKPFAYITFPNIQRYVQLGVLLGSIYIVQTFGEIFILTAGGRAPPRLTSPITCTSKCSTTSLWGWGRPPGSSSLILTEIVAMFALRLLSGLLRASTA